MRNYINADLYRIVHKKLRWVVLLAISIATVCFAVKGCESLYVAARTTIGNIAMMCVPMGVFEIMFVYGDDFKAKTMQIAIGSGLPRQKVIHAKWLEFMVVAAIDVLVFAVCALLASVINSGTDGGFDVATFFIVMFVAWLQMVVYVGCVMFIMFLTQGIGMAILVYLFLCMGILINQFLVQKLVETFDLNRFHIESYFLYQMLGTFQSRLILGEFSWTNALGILIYMMISFALASILFKKKELEF